MKKFLGLLLMVGFFSASANAKIAGADSLNDYDCMIKTEDGAVEAANPIGTTISAPSKDVAISLYLTILRASNSYPSISVSDARGTNKAEVRGIIKAVRCTLLK